MAEIGSEPVPFRLRYWLFGATVSGVALGLLSVGAWSLASPHLTSVATDRDVDDSTVRGRGLTGTALSLGGMRYRTFDGKMVRFDAGVQEADSDRATITVVNFWSSSCPPCVRELPVLEAASQRLRGQVEFVGITNDENRSSARQLASDAGVTYPLGDDPSGTIFGSLGLLVLPSTVLIGADAAVLDVITGPVEAADLDQRIEIALTETRVPHDS